PVFTSSATLDVAENSVAVVDLMASDADTVGGPASFEITGGADAALFQIRSEERRVGKAGKDFETDPHSYAVQVTASDGLNTAVQSIAVALIDVNDNAPVFTSSATPDVAEGDVAVVDLMASDADTVGGPASFEITGGADAALFQI